MLPTHLEGFQNGQVTLSVYQFNNPLRNTYWLKAGAGELELSEEDLDNLHELLADYFKPPMEASLKGVIYGLWSLILVAILFTILFTMGVMHV